MNDAAGGAAYAIPGDNPFVDGGGAEEVVGGTFHSFANTMLRRYARHFGWAETFTILDRSDSEDAIQLARTRLGLDRRERLRHFFEVNRYFVAIAALKALCDDGAVAPEVVRAAIEKYGVDPEKPKIGRAHV